MIDYNEKLLVHWDNLYQLADEQKVYFTSNNHVCVDVLNDGIKKNMLTEVHQVYYFVAKSREFLDNCKDCTEIKDKIPEIDT
jgi:hypothetical protein